MCEESKKGVRKRSDSDKKDRVQSSFMNGPKIPSLCVVCRIKSAFPVRLC